MKTVRDIKKAVRNLKVDSGEKIRSRVLDKLLAALDKPKNHTAAHQPNIWRIIMNKPITKLATAAAALLVIASAITILDHVAKPAYAIEQTIEAMRKARIVHLFCRDWHDDELEVWMKLNSETRFPDYIYIDYPKHDAQILSTPYISYQYFRGNSIFQFSNKQLMHFDIRLESIIEDIAAQQVKGSGGVDIQIYSSKKPDTGEDEITVLSKGEYDSLEIGIDPKTRLPTRINIIKTSNYGNFIKDYDEIYFDEEPPAGLFEFKIPEGAVVVNQDETEKLEEDPNSGLLLNGISRQQAADLLASEYFQSLINQDFEQLKKIYPATGSKPAKKVYKNLLGDNLPAELVKIGELSQEYGCTNNPILPCIVRHQDGTLKEYKLIIKFREINGQVSAVIAGLCGIPQEIESIH